MTLDYYDLKREEIRPLLPQRATRVLDVGCGRGATTRWLKTIYPNARFEGIEINGALSNELSEVYDKFYIANLSIEVPEVNKFDLVLLLDVLEHTVDPLHVLKKLVSFAESDAVLIVSVPNVAHYSVAAPLFFHGRFEYSDMGILDRTHLRFFVRESAVELMNSAGLRVVDGVVNGLQGSRAKLVDRLTLGRFRSLLVKQYVMKAVLNPGNTPQGEIDWRPSQDELASADT